MSTHQNALAKAVEIITRFEGFSTDAYPDPLHGWAVATIGYGTIRKPDGEKVEQGDTCTEVQARFWLLWEVEVHIKPILEQIPRWGAMNENQQAALISFSYNLGPHWYRAHNRESMTMLADSPDKWKDSEWVTKQFVKFRNPGSNVEKGLRRRREAEANLFMEGVGHDA
jgi:GH24 family phage-related lysozyme (muramidase)